MYSQYFYFMFTNRINHLTEQFSEEFRGLSDEQLNWKPSKEIWSIGQCIDHLIEANSRYIPRLREILNDKHRATFWEKNNPFTDYTGKNMIKNLGPEITRKYKAPKLFVPSKTKMNAGILDKFTKQQKEIENLFDILGTDNHSEKVITSPVAGLITLKVRDVMQLIIVHEERHLLQARNILKENNFPSKNGIAEITSNPEVNTRRPV